MEAEPVVPVAAAELTPMCSHALYVVHQGDISMTRTWKVFGLQTVLAAALTAAPSTSVAADKPDKINGKELADRIEALEKDVKKLTTSIDAINTTLLKSKVMQQKIQGLEEAMGRVSVDLPKALDQLKELTGKKKEYVPPEGADDIKDIKARLNRMEKILDDLRKNGRISRYAAPDEAGRVVMTNRYTEDILFNVNGTRYWLAPGTSRVLDGVPAGSVRYQVISPSYGLIVDRTRRLLPDGNLPIVVREPRPIVEIERS
jgi:hypothetical protein